MISIACTERISFDRFIPAAAPNSRVFRSPCAASRHSPARIHGLKRQCWRRIRLAGPLADTSLARPFNDDDSPRRLEGARCAASCSTSMRASISACSRPHLGPRAVRALLRFHGPLPCRRLAALVLVEPLSEGATLGSGGLVADAGARHPRLPRNLRRRLAEEVRARGHLPRPLRQRGRHAAASSTTTRSRSTSFPIT